MNPWDLEFTKEHLQRLFQEAQAARQGRTARVHKGRLANRFLLNTGELLISIGLRLKTRSGAASVEPHQPFMLDIG